ncbi:MAG: hypothetical protein PW788_02680 [Micavibrio sp.]|nr:hypothetical protein [Micavibrio sp.]
MHPFLQPRGIRNNNPGNIRLSAQKWHGQKVEQHDTAFIEFETPLAGLRALMKLLLTYQAKYGLDTVESIINRFAPPHENATDYYIYAVCRGLKVKRRDRLALTDPIVLAALARAIVQQENGTVAAKDAEWYPAALYTEAATLALKT